MIIFLIGFYSISAIYADSAIIEEIVKLEKENQRLNEEIINRLRFKLHGSKEFALHGESCKYLLE